MFFGEFLVLGILEFIEIASVALLPRNDGILEFSVMRSSGQARGWHTNGQWRNFRNDGILDGILNEIASAFSKPRNDEFWGILEFTREF